MATLLVLERAPAWCHSSLPAFPTARTTLQCTSQAPSPQTTRIALNVQYNGALFHGWEWKPELVTVQSTLQTALLGVTKNQIPISAASRTDAGAHAIGQVVHFDIERPYFAKAHTWTSALNSRLPPQIRITQSAFATPEFDARRSALWRRYRYTIRTDSTPNVFLDPLVWHYYQHELNVSRMNEAAQLLQSDTSRDLSAFRKAHAPAAHTNICVSQIAVMRNAGLVQLEVTADWFVYGMMRLLAATLLQVGSGALSMEKFGRIVREGRREDVRFSAPACGLCLMEVEYPKDLSPFGRTRGGVDGASLVQAGLQALDFPL